MSTRLYRSAVPEHDDAYWLIRQILMSTGGKAGLKLDDAALIDELRKFSDEAAGRYLQYVVVSKKSANKKLHQDLLDGLLAEAEKQVADDGVKYHLEELG